MSLLPTFAVQEAATSVDILEIPREYGIDFKTGQLTGEIVEKKEAIKVWIWNCLQTERYRFAIYSWDYGVGIEQYIGMVLTKEYIQTDCESEIREAMLINPWISDITDFAAERSGSKLSISFTAVTPFGKIGSAASEIVNIT